MRINALRSCIGLAALLLSCAFILAALADSYTKLFENFAMIKGRPLIMSVTLAAAMLVATSCSFAALAVDRRKNAQFFVEIAIIFLVSQPIKYLPGKIWGLAYQVVRTSQVVTKEVSIVASVNHMLATTFGSLLFFSINASANYTIFTCGWIVLGLWIFRGGVGAYRASEKRTVGAERSITILFLIFTEWCIFFGASYLLCHALSIDTGSAVTIAVSYSCAWVFGSLLAIAPGGVGIREAAFVVVSSQFGIPQEDAILYAVGARLVFTAAELLMFFLAAVTLRIRRYSVI